MMRHPDKHITVQAGDELPFPLEWVQAEPRKVQEILSGMPVLEQARCVMQAQGRQKQDLLLLSPKASEVVRALSSEEVYYMVKEIGATDALPVLSAISQEQLQYIFDIEWWQGDKFLPQRARDWLVILEKCQDQKILHWLLNENLDQKVMVLQSLIKVFKMDEMTDSYQDVEGLARFSPDGVYDIFFKVPEVASVLAKFLGILRAEHEKIFFLLMEAVIWHPVSPTVEDAYHERLTRTADRGIPEFEEAYEIYRRQDLDALKVEAASPETFLMGDGYKVAPHYLMAQAKPSSFFSLCLSRLQTDPRIDAIRWELVYLTNKVMVADRCDPSELKLHNEIIRKVLGFINIGLEAGSGGNVDKGVLLLKQTWMQPLFQVGYGHLMEFKWQAEKLVKEHGPLLDHLLNDNERDLMSSLMVNRVPMFTKAPEKKKRNPQPRNFESIEEIQTAEEFLRRMKFYVRFSKHGLNLKEAALTKIRQQCDFSGHPEDLDLVVLTTTALARHLLFREISCIPLPEAAAKTFLELVFPPRIFQDEPRKCNEDLVEKFHRKLLAMPMAWTDEDKKFLQYLVAQCIQSVESRFGGIDFKAGVDWKFAGGICLSVKK